MTFSEQFITIMDAVCDKFGIVIDWTAQNVVPYMTELGGRVVKYEIATSIVWLVVGCFMLIGLYALYKKGKRDRWDEAWIPFVFISIFTVISSVSLIGGHVFNIIETIFLPEMVIIQFLSQFI